LTKSADGFVEGLCFRDVESGEEFVARARVVINATGPFADALRREADSSSEPIIAPSQGIHLVFDRSFLPGESAILVPRTRDGRVLFAIPWHEHTLVGTTDTPVVEPILEPAATEQEVDFILETAALYLARKPTRADVLSVFAGIRPLVRSAQAGGTANLARDHTIRIDPSGLITVCGGKWTTYRRMAEGCVDQAAVLARLPERLCVTADLPILPPDDAGIESLIKDDASLAARLRSDLPYNEAQVIWAAREEMARTVEDVLARRTRALFLNARAAVAMAPRVAELMAAELARDARWKQEQVADFGQIARNYLLKGG
jgi:glycerol-3-phosphate dehydrogenase